MPRPVTLPGPVVVTWSVGSKIAVASALAETVSRHGPPPEQAPDQPTNIQPPLVRGVSVTSLPGASV